jgi:hypothetical protein
MDRFLSLAVCLAPVLVCWPSAGWQRGLLTICAWCVRLAILAASLGLALYFLDPTLIPALLGEPLQELQHVWGLGRAELCWSLAALLALGAPPLLALLDFGRALADYRALTQCVLHILRQVEGLPDARSLADLSGQPLASRPSAARPRAAATQSRGLGSRRRLDELDDLIP